MNENNEFPKEAQEELCIIEKSEKYIILILISVILSLKSLYIDKSNLINIVCHPDEPERIIDNFRLRYSSNIITSAGLVFFYCVAKKRFFTNTDKTDCSPSYNYAASTLVLFAGFIRLFDILYNRYRLCSDLSTDTEATVENQIAQEFPEPDVIL